MLDGITQHDDDDDDDEHVTAFKFIQSGKRYLPDANYKLNCL